MVQPLSTSQQCSFVKKWPYVTRGRSWRVESDWQQLISLRTRMYHNIFKRTATTARVNLRLRPKWDLWKIYLHFLREGVPPYFVKVVYKPQILYHQSFWYLQEVFLCFSVLPQQQKSSEVSVGRLWVCREAASGAAAATCCHHPQGSLRCWPAGRGCHIRLGREGGCGPFFLTIK